MVKTAYAVIFLLGVTLFIYAFYGCGEAHSDDNPIIPTYTDAGETSGQSYININLRDSSGGYTYSNRHLPIHPDSLPRTNINYVSLSSTGTYKLTVTSNWKFSYKGAITLSLHGKVLHTVSLSSPGSDSFTKYIHYPPGYEPLRFALKIDIK